MDNKPCRHRSRVATSTQDQPTYKYLFSPADYLTLSNPIPVSISEICGGKLVNKTVISPPHYIMKLSGWRSTLQFSIEQYGNAIKAIMEMPHKHRSREEAEDILLQVIYAKEKLDRKRTRLNSSHIHKSRMPSSA